MNTHLQKAVNALPENMDALLVTNTRNQRWLTDFNFEDGFILVTRKESYLLTDSRYIEAAENETKGITVLQMTGKRSEMFKKLLDANFIEGMACTGGCIGGAGCLTHGPRSRAEVDKYGMEANDKTITEALAALEPKP